MREMRWTWQAPWTALLAAVLSGWFGGSVATGQRGMGASFAWLVPVIIVGAGGGFAVVAVRWLRQRRDTRPDGLVTVFPGSGAAIGSPRPPRLMDGHVAFPFLEVVAIALLLGSLWVSDDLNHAWATLPRVRGVTALLAAIAVVSRLAIAAVESETPSPNASVATGAGSVRPSGSSVTDVGVLRRRGNAGDRATAPLLVLGGAFAFFVATASGELVTPDEWTAHGAAVGLVEHGRLAVFDGEPYPFTVVGIVRRPDHPGEEASGLMSKYPVLSSLAITPFQAVARLLGAPGPRIAGEGPLARRAPDLVTLGFGPFLGALTVMVTYLMAGSLGYRGAASLLPAVAVATASLVWPYSRTLLNMALPAALTGAALAVIGYLRGVSASPTPLVERRFAAGFERSNSEPIPLPTASPPDVYALRSGFSAGRMAALAGALLGLAGAARYEYLVLALPLWALLAWVVFQRSGLAGGAFLGGLAVVAGSATALPLTLGYNLLRTGHALDFGYGGEGFLSSLLAKPWYGWFGLLFSPGCGVAVHAPMMFVGLVGLVWLWEDAPDTAVAVAAMVGLACLYYGSLETTWCAQTTWGPRYLVGVAPLAYLPIAAIVKRMGRAKQGDVHPHPNAPDVYALRFEAMGLEKHINQAGFVRNEHINKGGDGVGWGESEARGKEGMGGNPFAWLAIGLPWALNFVANALAIVVDFSRGWQDHWSLGATYLATTWVPYFSGITAHVRLARLWLHGGDASLDIHWLRASDGTPAVSGALIMAGLLVVSVTAWAAAWQVERLAEEGDGPVT